MRLYIQFIKLCDAKMNLISHLCIIRLWLWGLITIGHPNLPRLCSNVVVCSSVFLNRFFALLACSCYRMLVGFNNCNDILLHFRSQLQYLYLNSNLCLLTLKETCSKGSMLNPLLSPSTDILEILVYFIQKVHILKEIFDF